MSKTDNHSKPPVDEALLDDIDDSVDEKVSEEASLEADDDGDIDDGAFSDEPEALALMVEDDLDEAILAQPADPFDRISVRKAEKAFHGELPPNRDEDDL